MSANACCLSVLALQEIDYMSMVYPAFHPMAAGIGLDKRKRRNAWMGIVCVYVGISCHLNNCSWLEMMVHTEFGILVFYPFKRNVRACEMNKKIRRSDKTTV